MIRISQKQIGGDFFITFSIVSSNFSSSNRNTGIKQEIDTKTHGGDTKHTTYTPHRMERKDKVLIIKWRQEKWRKTR